MEKELTTFLLTRIEHCKYRHFKIALKCEVFFCFVPVWRRCFGEDPCISIPDIKAMVMVLVPSTPQIGITGTERATIPAAELQAPHGVALFEEIHIISTVTRSDGTLNLGIFYSVFDMDVVYFYKHDH